MSGAVVVVLIAVAGGLFAVAAALAVWRIIRGPSILDRLIASDVLIAVLLGALAVQMVARHTIDTLPVMLALAACAFLGTVAVARYVSRRGGS